MYGIFMESWVMFKQYAGSGFLMLLYLAALVFLLIREKRRPVRVLFVYFPMAVLFLFFFPLFRRVYVRVTNSGDTQYRMLWLLPAGATIARAGCLATTLLPMRGKALWLRRLFDRALLPLCVAVAIALCGSMVYRNPYVSRAENAWHIPQEAIRVSERITQELEEGRRVRAAVPDDLVHFIRQYDTDIILAYGRDIVAYGYYNEVHEQLEKPAVIDMEALADALREAEVDVLVLRKDKPVDRAPEEAGWKQYAETEEYRLYRDMKKGNHAS